MRFLVKENLLDPALEALRKAGTHVTWATENAVGTPNIILLEWRGHNTCAWLPFAKELGEPARIEQEPKRLGAEAIEVTLRASA